MTAPKRLALIGHRGAGKTSLLVRIEKIYRSAGRRVKTFDLDKEIEQHAGRRLSAIFQEDGEAVFRRLETSAFERLEKEIARTTDDVVIALGAGYPVATLKTDWHAIWVRRASDETGRIFNDRPRLDSRLSALEEFRTRFKERSPKFKERADDILFLDEGSEETPSTPGTPLVSQVSKLDPAERDYFLDRITDIGGALTVLPDCFSRDFEAWAMKRKTWGIHWFELRDDLLSHEQMVLATQNLPRQNILISYRDPAREVQTAALVDSVSAAFDWPSERGPCRRGKPTYISAHERSSTIEAALSQLEESAVDNSSLKAALVVDNFNELMIGHAWQMKEPIARVFLPMSQDGRWNWYRLLRLNDLSLNFVRESVGSASDQPSLLQWLRRHGISKTATQEMKSFFAAVLGDPVSHSRTPMEQAEFFRARGLSVLAVRVTEKEWQEGAIQSLQSIGLRYAAVTAPLKKLAFELANKLSLDPISKKFESINTLAFNSADAQWTATNTDIEGLRRAATLHTTEIASSRVIAVWGGGGTLDVLKTVFPQAHFYSVRSQKVRDTGAAGDPPDMVVWAASLNQDVDPPALWAPTVVFDLNYSESSPARDYALKMKATYISGLAMFRAQAQAQREFWGEKS